MKRKYTDDSSQSAAQIKFESDLEKARVVWDSFSNSQKMRVIALDREVTRMGDLFMHLSKEGAKKPTE